jgi:hypothetical protein
MRLPLGISPIRPACERCGGKTMFAGRRPHPTRGMPWELQTFVCMVCSAVTVREPEGGTATNGVRGSDSTTMPSAVWTTAYGIHTTRLDGQTYRIVAYPNGSPLAGKFGCYCDGRYTGLAANLAAAKTWCCTLAGSGACCRPGE